MSTGMGPADGLESYLPADASVLAQNTTVGDLLRRVAAEVPGRTALISAPTLEFPQARTWSYAELLTQSEEFARRLLVDFHAGERIAVWAANKPEWVILQFAAALAGLPLVTLNPANRVEELRYLLTVSAVSGLYLDRSFRGIDNVQVISALLPHLPSLRRLTYFDEWSAYSSRPHHNTPLPIVSGSDPALLLFTSGTTGKPKCVVLTHQGIVNNARGTASRLELARGSVWLSVLPFFHVGGSVTNTLGCLVNRGSHVTMREFNAGAMLAAIAQYRANVTMGVPMMVLAMLEHESFAATDLSSLQLFLTGGTTIPPTLVQVIRERFGTDVGVIFGQTEAGGAMCVSRRADSEERLCNTVGQPLSSYELKVIHVSDSRTLPRGQVGEICVRSPCTMREYLDNPEQTAQAVDPDGWVHTGDLGLMRPDGYVAITGRLKDMVIRGGENIYPREIEDQLIQHPLVAQVAVFGIPDERWGEQLVGGVIAKPGQTVTGDELAAFLTNKIGRHKIPKYWVFLEQLPTNPSGKVQKFLLREQFIAAQAEENKLLP